MTQAEAPFDGVEEWFVTLYRLKRAQVSMEPELYRAYAEAAEMRKLSVVAHLGELRRQLHELLHRAEPDLDAVTIELHSRLLRDATSSFQHPKLVAEHVHEDREARLRQVVRAMIQTLKAKP